MPNTDIIPLGSSCAFCNRSNGERHTEACPVGSRLGRTRVRVAAALAEREPADQARGTMTVLEDAAADCENDLDSMTAMMTLAEAREAFAHVQTEEATSIALDGLETLFGESFTEAAIARPSAPALSGTTLTCCQRALDTRLVDVEAELAQAGNQRYYMHGVPVAQVIDELETERDIIREALAELQRAMLAAGTSAA